MIVAVCVIMTIKCTHDSACILQTIKDKIKMYHLLYKNVPTYTEYDHGAKYKGKLNNDLITMSQFNYR